MSLAQLAHCREHKQKEAPYHSAGLADIYQNRIARYFFSSAFFSSAIFVYLFFWYACTGLMSMACLHFPDGLHFISRRIYCKRGHGKCSNKCCKYHDFLYRWSFVVDGSWLAEGDFTIINWMWSIKTIKYNRSYPACTRLMVAQ